MTVLFNANTRSAYQAGYFSGSFAVAELLAHGDFGLGALDRNDGELVILDGHAYRTAEDGATTELTPNATTPYATVVPFATGLSFEVSTPSDKQAFEQNLSALVPLANRTWALRISGMFEYVIAGASKAQERPFLPIADVMPSYNYIRHENTSGTLVAFYCPVYLTGVNSVGVHYHWLSDDRAQGGHVGVGTNFVVRKARVEACEATSYLVRLPAAEDFHALDLTPYYGKV